MASDTPESADKPTGAAPVSRVLGLTGAIGCGKTTVGDLLLELGALERIDADRVVHSLMAPGTHVTAEIREAFGVDILTPDGAVDRPALARVVFGDSVRLRQLEGIVHPAVREAIRERIAQLHGHDGVIVVDAVRLLQSDLLPLTEEVWVVSCSAKAQLGRLIEVRGMTRDQAQKRLAAQPSFEHERVTRVIENSGSLEDLREQVIAAWRAFIHAT